jgi:putative inorganic carbon (HCO3(-)) transporter
MKKEKIVFILNKTIEVSLFFIFVLVPLIINPTAYDYFYKPKIESVYALIIIANLSWLVRDLFFKKFFRWGKNPLTIPLLIYAFLCIVSTFNSVAPVLSLKGDVLREEGLFALLSYVSLVFLMVNLIRDRDRGMRLLIGLAYSTILLSLYGLFQYFGYNFTEHFIYKSSPGRVSSTIGNPNFLGKYLVLTLPLIIAFYFQSNRIIKHVFFAGGTTLAFACLILTYSRGSWIGFCFGFFFFLILLQRFAVKYPVRDVLVIGALFLLTIIFFNLYRPKVEGIETPKGKGMVVHRALSSKEIDSGIGVATRLFVWKKALILIAQRPWFGYGPETFEKTFHPYNLEYAKRFNDYVRVDRIHNNYLDLAFSVGVLGLAAYLSILGVFFFYLFRAIKKSMEEPWKMIYIGIISGFIGYLINDLFIFSVVSVSPTFWSLIGLSITLRDKA